VQLGHAKFDLDIFEHLYSPFIRKQEITDHAQVRAMVCK
ncbi:MAG: hypothetical protein ACI84C_000497, partial [Flavobacteriales bacterium]